MFFLVPSIRYFSPLCKMEFPGSLTPAAGKNRMNASEQKQKGRILDMAEKKAEKNEFLFDLKTPETTWKGHSKGANSDVGSITDAEGEHGLYWCLDSVMHPNGEDGQE